MFRSPLYQISNQFRLSTTSILNVKDWAVESNVLREKSGNSFIDKVFYNKYTLIGKALLENYSDNLSFNFLFLHGDPNPRHGTGQNGLFYLVFLPFLLLGMYVFYKKNPPVFLVLGLWWLLALLPASVPESTPHALRSLNALLPMSVLIGTGMAKSLEYLFAGNISQKLFGILYGIGIFVSVAYFSNYYFTQYPNRSAKSWQGGFKEVSLAIDNKKDSVRDVWVNINDDRYFLWQLTYGNYDIEAIQKYLQDKNEPQHISNVIFQQYLWSDLDTLDHKVIIVGTAEEINSKLVETGHIPTWREDIEVKGSKEIYSLVGFGK